MLKKLAKQNACTYKYKQRNPERSNQNTRMNTCSDTPQQNAKMYTGPRSPSNTISDDIAKNLSLIRKETNTSKNDTESIFNESSMSPPRVPRGKNLI